MQSSSKTPQTPPHFWKHRKSGSTGQRSRKPPRRTRSTLLRLPSPFTLILLLYLTFAVGFIFVSPHSHPLFHVVSALRFFEEKRGCKNLALFQLTASKGHASKQNLMANRAVKRTPLVGDICWRKRPTKDCPLNSSGTYSPFFLL